MFRYLFKTITKKQNKQTSINGYLFLGRVTVQEFRKLPTAAMDDYMNKLKELSPVHRERNSHQTWLHQGKFASKTMQKLRER